MTAADLIAAIRLELLDEDTPYRWSDDELIGWINDGMQALFSRRPDCVVLDDDETIRLDRPADLEEAGDTVPMDLKWRPALCHYVCARANTSENDELEAGAAGRAAAYMGAFEGECRVA